MGILKLSMINAINYKIIEDFVATIYSTDEGFMQGTLAQMAANILMINNPADTPMRNAETWACDGDIHYMH